MTKRDFLFTCRVLAAIVGAPVAFVLICANTGALVPILIAVAGGIMILIGAVSWARIGYCMFKRWRGR